MRWFRVKWWQLKAWWVRVDRLDEDVSWLIAESFRSQEDLRDMEDELWYLQHRLDQLEASFDEVLSEQHRSIHDLTDEQLLAAYGVGGDYGDYGQEG